jgi:hypothetical protein
MGDEEVWGEREKMRRVRERVNRENDEWNCVGAEILMCKDFEKANKYFKASAISYCIDCIQYD